MVKTHKLLLPLVVDDISGLMLDDMYCIVQNGISRVWNVACFGD
jgi:hypothetical protein